MAVEYLTEGSTSYAAAAWSGSGFAVNATLIQDRNTAQAIVTSIDQSAIDQVDYLKIGRGFSGSIGSGSAPLKFGALSATLNAKGFFNDSNASIYFQAACAGGAAGGAANTIAYYSQSGPASRAWCVGGALTTFDIGAGMFECATGTTNTTANVGGGSVIISYNASGGTTLTIFGGTVVCKRQYTNIYVYGGRLVYDPEGTGTITTAVCGPKGTWDHRGGDITTGTIAGSFTVANLNRSCTIGGTALTTWPTANINRTTPSTVVATFSNETKVAGGPATGTAGIPGGGVGV